MMLCKFMLGNTSSGIIEAASFGKFVFNLGDRQKGRETSGNVIHLNIDKKQIMTAVNKSVENYKGDNIYKGRRLASELIIETLKKY